MKKLFNIDPKLLEESKVVDWGYTEELRPRSFDTYLKWVEDGCHGPLKYLEDERRLKRESLKEVYPECESALVFLFTYIDAKKYELEQNPKNKIASYTIGFEDQDYHFWIKEKLDILGQELSKKFEGLEYKFSLDVHPVLERDLAFRSGLGWFGKNSMLINKEHGSYTLIGSLLLNQKLDIQTSNLEVDHCGNCTRCIDACPTNAIDPVKRTVNANHCISTFTIEMFKDVPPPKGYPVESQEVFGCDICQEVCPWNNKPLKKINADHFEESDLVAFFNRELDPIIYDVEQMSNRQFKEFFKRTSFERVGKRGLLKNLKHYLEIS